MSEKCQNKNSDHPLTSLHTNGGNKDKFENFTIVTIIVVFKSDGLDPASNGALKNGVLTELNIARLQ